jgi:hypothetical protein
MLGKYFSIFLYSFSAMIFLLRSLSLMSRGRFLAGWKLIAYPPSRVETVCIYLLVFIFFTGLVLEGFGLISMP